MKQAVLTVSGKDRPGIISDITGILYKGGANLEDISMTILEGEFSMILIMKLPARGGSALKEALGRFEEKSDLTIHLKDLAHSARKGSKHSRGSSSYILSAAGKDKTGIVYQISGLFAKEGLNITDLNSRILPGQKSDVYVVMLEVDLPRTVKADRINRLLLKLGKKIGVDITFKPVERLDF